MFVASGLYRYATGASSSTADPTASTSRSTLDGPPPSASTRVKRHPKRTARKDKGKARAGSKYPGKVDDAIPPELPGSPPPSYASIASGSTQEEKRQATEAKAAIIDSILAEEDLYKLLGVKRNAKTDEIRRGFLNRSRSCHPDKFPNYPAATSAFQKVSFAYETLSKPSSRRMYDVSGRTDIAAAMNTNDDDVGGAGTGDDTLNGVLWSVLTEFMDGDFEMIRVLVNALNEGNPTMNLGEDAVDSIEGAFKRLRDIMLAGRRYLSIIKFELIRLYEIQQSLRQLSYFNISGRLRLTLQLARVTINIPLAIDQAMKDKDAAAAAGDEGAKTKQEANEATYDDSDASDLSSDDEEDDVPVDHRRHGASNRSSSHSRTHPRSNFANTDFGIAPEDDSFSDSEHPHRGSTPSGSATAEHERLLRHRRRLRRAQRKAEKRERRGKISHARTKSAGGSGQTSQSERERTTATQDDTEGADTASGRSGSSTPHDDGKHTQLQRKGLLPATAVGLLVGIVKVLETSEAWIPGGGATGANKD